VKSVINADMIAPHNPPEIRASLRNFEVCGEEVVMAPH